MKKKLDYTHEELNNINKNFNCHTINKMEDKHFTKKLINRELLYSILQSETISEKMEVIKMLAFINEITK